MTNRDLRAITIPRATIEPAAVNGRCWDVVVIGAGPAGGIAARQSALRGLTTLLVDRKAFPREKVCGGCLNAAAIGILDSVGLADLPGRLGAVRLTRFSLRTAGHCATIALPEGVAVSRSAFDAALVSEAVAAGATFLPETMACPEPGDAEMPVRTVRLDHRGRTVGRVTAGVVLAAGGLGHPGLSQREEFRSEVSPDARIGVGTLLDRFPEQYAVGTIHMAVARNGYVGLVRVDGDRLNIAAAVDAEPMRKESSPAAVVAAILEQAGFPKIESLNSACWQGTVPLTRHLTQPAGTRLLVLGDAAGYVEPFTGEGMAWALAGGLAAARLVPRDVDHWNETIEQQWSRRQQQQIGSRQRWCRRLAGLLRHPVGVNLTVRMLGRFPNLARPIVNRLNTMER